MDGQDSKPGLPAAVTRQSLRTSALGMIDRIKGQRSAATVLDEGKSLIQTLRDTREFDLLDQLTGELRRAGAADPKIRRLQAQSYIERGKPELAIDVLE